MPIPLYLAMTVRELAYCPGLPERVAFMACHFSPYGIGIHNCPGQLPNGAILILNDRIPICGHDPESVAQQLQAAVERTGAEAVLLDLERPGAAQTETIVRAITETLSCPVAVSEYYAKALDCAVFVSVPPPEVPLETHLAPWVGRELWLEAALTCREYTVTKTDSQYVDMPFGERAAEYRTEERLHCRYRITVEEDQAVFTLWRDRECMDSLLKEAATMGVTKAVGLYQQFKIL